MPGPPGAPGAPGPPGAPGAGGFSLAELNAALNTALNTALAPNLLVLGRIEHRTSAALDIARSINSQATENNSPLWRVPHPDTGTMPPAALFPATRGTLKSLEEESADRLLLFYGLPLHGDVEGKRQALAMLFRCAPL